MKQGVLVEDKARLGSAPPNCHNRCNECTPCTAVPDPTAPDRPKDKHSNYKPLGWKCRCGDNLYNP
ncbi:EPIDERMAL PATTERNING FACTOR-like protein 1 [Musa troglodytarum]|uniref:Epidermal patterning factor-like protein n=1 Tax=Musa troglodytarum TaxID=320322 RepID=A0A9E7G2C7_9LILI|nr:EPIDERMAL PATTERNING FACTOR-like protein 1 [Musa troglodytarum]